MSKFYPGQLVRFNANAYQLKFKIALIIAVEKRSYANTLLTIFLNGRLEQFHENWFTKVSC